MSLLLATVFLFSQCQKDGPGEIAPSVLTEEISAVSTTSASGTLNVSRASRESGYAYVLKQNLNTTGDSQSDPTISKVRIFENGKEIGPAHSVHDEIRKIGTGKFSHWGGSIYFSTSDNSDPRTNGRKYTYTTESATAVITQPSTTAIALNVSGAVKDAGYAYELEQDFKTTGDSQTQPTISTLRVFEDGRELGPAHSVHNDIRNIGKGRFSHWGSSLYFSASDNSDPRTNGRKYTYTIGTSSSTTTPESSEPAPAPAPTTPISTDGLIGYATVDGMTTGGKGGQTVTVSSLSALTSAAGSSSPMIIYVSGTITGKGSVMIKSNKSIIGLSGATLDGVGLKVYNASNVIIQNLKIKNVLAGTDDNDCINTKYSHHIWIDHCELSSDRTHGWEYWDGLLDITRESNYITVSWTILRDSHMGSLVGGGLAGHESDKGKLKVTYHHNYFYNLSERAPDMKYGYVHMFNNYHLNNSGYSIAALAGGTVRTDNNYFSNCAKPITTTYNGLAAGYVSGASTNMYVGSGNRNITTSESSWVPSYEYKSALHAASEVPSIVKNGAGPR